MIIYNPLDNEMGRRPKQPLTIYPVTSLSLANVVHTFLQVGTNTIHIFKTSYAFDNQSCFTGFDGMISFTHSSLENIWIEAPRKRVALLSLLQMHCQCIVIHLQPCSVKAGKTVSTEKNWIHDPNFKNIGQKRKGRLKIIANDDIQRFLTIMQVDAMLQAL